jgi:hypothetical protein
MGIPTSAFDLVIGTPLYPRIPRDVLIRDQADRDAISSRLMRCRDPNGQDWATSSTFLTVYPDARRGVVRVLGELEDSS